MSASRPWVRRSSRGASKLSSQISGVVHDSDADDDWWDSAVAEDAVAEVDDATPAPTPESTTRETTHTADSDRLAVALARPFPAGWPSPHLPFGRVQSELSRLSADQLAQLRLGSAEDGAITPWLTVVVTCAAAVAEDTCASEAVTRVLCAARAGVGAITGSRTWWQTRRAKTGW